MRVLEHKTKTWYTVTGTKDTENPLRRYPVTIQDSELRVKTLVNRLSELQSFASMGYKGCTEDDIRVIDESIVLHKQLLIDAKKAYALTIARESKDEFER